MSDPAPETDAMDPATAYRTLAEEPGAVLIDVRCAAEWAFVGLPDIADTGRPLWRIEWASWPEMTPDPEGFAAALGAHLATAGTPPTRLMFLCRSGQRSQAAAERATREAAAGGLAHVCTNVIEGFEGDRDAHGHRGTANGWKARGLPWVQS